MSMKANELMIGDWYWWEAEGKKYPMQVTKDTFKLSDKDISNFQPIPLTPKILEKNGFEREPFVTHCDMYSGIDRRVNMHNSKEYANSNNEWYVHIDSEDYSTIANCELAYVHELQQILRLCEIDKEIIV